MVTTPIRNPQKSEKRSDRISNRTEHPQSRPLRFARAQHACAIIESPSADDSSQKSILVTGGVLGSSTDKDEMFDLTERTSETMDSMNIPRYNHQMVTLGQKVFAMGGVTQTQHTVKDVEVFDAGSKSWSLHSSTLLSKSTDDLAVTELPSSSVSCNKDCECGVRSGARIVGGTDAQVIPKKTNLFCSSFSGWKPSMAGTFAY